MERSILRGEAEDMRREDISLFINLTILEPTVPGMFLSISSFGKLPIINLSRKDGKFITTTEYQMTTALPTFLPNLKGNID